MRFSKKKKKKKKEINVKICRIRVSKRILNVITIVK